METDKKVVEAFGSIAKAEMGRQKVPYFKKNTQGICTIVHFRSKFIEAYGDSLILDVAIKTSQATAPGAETAQPGSRASQLFWVNNPERGKGGIPMKAQMAQRDVKGLLLGALREEDSAVSPEQFNEALTEAVNENALRGIDVFYTVGDKGFPRFFKAPPQTPEDVAKQRAELDVTHPVMS